MLLHMKGVILVISILLSYQHLKTNACDDDTALEDEEGDSRFGELEERLLDDEVVEDPLDVSERAYRPSGHRISAGSTVKTIEDYPFFMLVNVYYKWLGLSRCGGARLNDRIVLTAAHCFLEKNATLNNDISFVGVGAGIESSYNFDQWITKICWPADYKNYTPDIALLRTEFPFSDEFLEKFDGEVRLPIGPIEADQQAWFLGMGRTSPNDTAGNGHKLRELPVKRVNCTRSKDPRRICFKSSDPNYVGAACVGDSGGPVVASQPGTKGKRNYIYGISSTGNGICEEGKNEGDSGFANIYYLMPELVNLFEECSKPLPGHQRSAHSSRPRISRNNGVMSLTLPGRPPAGELYP